MFQIFSRMKRFLHAVLHIIQLFLNNTSLPYCDEPSILSFQALNQKRDPYKHKIANKTMSLIKKPSVCCTPDINRERKQFVKYTAHQAIKKGIHHITTPAARQNVIYLERSKIAILTFFCFLSCFIYGRSNNEVSSQMNHKVGANFNCFLFISFGHRHLHWDFVS